MNSFNSIANIMPENLVLAMSVTCGTGAATTPTTAAPSTTAITTKAPNTTAAPSCSAHGFSADDPTSIGLLVLIGVLLVAVVALSVALGLLRNPPHYASIESQDNVRNDPYPEPPQHHLVRNDPYPEPPQHRHLQNDPYPEHRHLQNDRGPPHHRRS